jgi:hypothetical protein
MLAGSPKGCFSGGCDWDKGVEGKACFPVFLRNIPDGQYVIVVDG